MMCGIELVTDKTTKAPALQVGGKVVGEARRRGLITRIRTGQGGDHPIGDTICLAPPLVITFPIPHCRPVRMLSGYLETSFEPRP